MEKETSITIIIAGVLIALAIILSPNGTDESYVVNFPLEGNGGLAVNIQDQATRIFDIPVNQVLDSTSYSLATVPVINSYILELNTTAGLNVGDKITFLEQNGIEQIHFGNIMSINGNNITMNAPVPYNYTPLRTSVFTFDNQLNVDGSVTPQAFQLCNFFDAAVDITRIIFACTDDTEMHDGLFCSEPQLARGIEFRKLTKDGYYINYFNIRNNGKWGLLSYDIDYSDKGKPPDDTYGFRSMLTFAGQNKHGVVIRLKPNECIELLVQDDLTDISRASLMVEGHFTQD